MDLVVPQQFNPASRLYRILDEGAALPDNMAGLKAWALLFHMEEPYEVKLSIDVAERLLWLNQELDLLRALLRDSGSEEESDAVVLGHLEQALSPVYLATNWESVRQFLSADTLNPLESWTEVLPESEIPIKQEELDGIVAEAAELEKLVDSLPLAHELRFLISEHIKLIRKAIAGYSIIGVRALQAGVFFAFGELAYAQATLKESSGPEVRKLIGLWEKAGRLAHSAIAEEAPKTRENPWTLFA